MEAPAGRPQRILVTGTSGFIGSHLAEALVSRGYQVFGLDVGEPSHAIRDVQNVQADLRDSPSVVRVVREVGPDAVLHLAARTDLNETRDIAGYSANIEGVENVLSAIRATPTVRRAICTSSQLVCGVGYLPRHDEDYRPTTLYGQSKVRTERTWRSSDGAGTEWCIVRPTTIWGPRMNPHYLRFFRMIRDGTYRHIGRGATLKSYGYVGNTVTQYVRLLEAPAAAIHRRLFFLADYEPIALEAWADAFQAALGAPPIRTLSIGTARVAARIGDLVNFIGLKRFPFNSFRLNNVLTPYRADLSSTRAVCGDLPFTMAEGVAETAQWLRTVWDLKSDSRGG